MPDLNQMPEINYQMSEINFQVLVSNNQATFNHYMTIGRHTNVKVNP